MDSAEKGRARGELHTLLQQHGGEREEPDCRTEVTGGKAFLSALFQYIAVHKLAYINGTLKTDFKDAAFWGFGATGLVVVAKVGLHVGQLFREPDLAPGSYPAAAQDIGGGEATPIHAKSTRRPVPSIPVDSLDGTLLLVYLYAISWDRRDPGMSFGVVLGVVSTFLGILDAIPHRGAFASVAIVVTIASTWLKDVSAGKSALPDVGTLGSRT
eukprot:gene12079-biopygen3023